eukprot:CAMPEP_0202391634 /NCGR_PEP_ID=MMETSP1127-20130417/91939_1 /ASSEMBLY_ACC=CAM_ASM_000462 /TAXON_ID=3047 /ORGANISM="Dunaliella tertiolecta, Strain CCMP1320" /LENGTH=41 /DNA_ID= /DNA_START= /DNA_END= /DNA_ORIENTATION=
MVVPFMTQRLILRGMGAQGMDYGCKHKEIHCRKPPGWIPDG